MVNITMKYGKEHHSHLIAEDIWRNALFDSVPKTRRYDRLLLEQDGKCESCNGLPFHNGKPLTFQIDHRDGNRENNSRENLRVICPNCHTQTENWGSRNVSEEGRLRLGWRRK